MTPKFSFDIDGVLADFTSPFTEIVNRQNGLSLSPEWPTYNAYGPDQLMTTQQWRNAWEEFLDTDQVWATLPSLPFVDFEGIDEMMERVDFHGYFVTHRRNTTSGFYRDVTTQTKDWLHSQGITHYTGVIAGTEYSRSILLNQLKIDAHLDDWGDQFTTLRDAGVNCYLIDRSHNQDTNAGEFRVSTVDEFISKSFRQFEQANLKTLRSH